MLLALITYSKGAPFYNALTETDSLQWTAKAFPMEYATEFLHARNATLIAYFKSNSVYDSKTDTYQLHARPDLTDGLHDLIAEAGIPHGEIRGDSIYGWPIAATHNGVIFAWAGGTHDFFLRVREDRVDAACKDGARVDPTYPPEWLNFYMMRLGQNWRVVLKRWLKTAYEDALVE